VLIGVVAIIGVLLHAAALVRHHASMVAMPAAERALLADLGGAICNAAGGASVKDGAEVPDAPSHPGGADCPICMGLASAYLPAAPPCVSAPLKTPLDATWPWSEQVVDRIVALHSFARGPPAVG
jgi:hypothetical protein